MPRDAAARRPKRGANWREPRQLGAGARLRRHAGGFVAGLLLLVAVAAVALMQGSTGHSAAQVAFDALASGPSATFCHEPGDEISSHELPGWAQCETPGAGQYDLESGALGSCKIKRDLRPFPNVGILTDNINESRGNL